MHMQSITRILTPLALVFAGSVAMAQETPATIPAGFTGTYELTYGDFSNGSVTAYSDGESVTFVIKANGNLCIGGEEATNPVFKNGNSVEAFWTDSDGLEYGFSNISSGTFNEANLFQNGSFAGQFTGSKTSDATTCASGGGGGPVTIDSNTQTMLDLAEEVFGQIFKNGGELKSAGGYVYRFYPSSGAYLGFKNGKVFTVGGPFGTGIKERGSISQVTVALNNYKAEIGLDAGDIDVGNGTDDPDITGDFTLVIDGTVTTVAAGISIPTAFSVTIENIAGPEDPSDTDEITDVIEETLEGYEGIEDLTVVVTNNTSSRITFTVSFTAKQNGVTVEMDLEYDYTK